MTATSVPTTPTIGALEVQRRPWAVEHRPFLIALALGALIRLVVMLAYSPAFIHSDGPGYLFAIDPLQPLSDRPVGYILYLLKPLSWISTDATLVSAVQHLIGMLTAVIGYVVLRRWGVGRWPATLAALPVLFDTLQLNLEHSTHTDTLFTLLVILGLVLLIWKRRLLLPYALAAGLFLGLAVTVRQVGAVLGLAVVVAALLLGGTSWRQRIAVAVVGVVGFTVPVAAYASWYHSERGAYALTEYTGQALYARVTSFVDCSRITVPDYQRVLCPAEPVGKRTDPSYYAFDDPRTVPLLEPPAGVTEDEAMREFALAAIRAQPLAYAAVAARDLALNFDYYRGDRFELNTAYKWTFSYYDNLPPTWKTEASYAAHGGQLQTRQPYADYLAVYEKVGYTPGPVLLGCLLLGLAAALGVGRAARSGLRSATLVLLLGAVVLLVVPGLTAQFVWRYQLPALVLLPAAAALAWTALRGGRAPEAPDEPDRAGQETRATASTV